MLDESVFGWKCFWKSFFFAIWMKVVVERRAELEEVKNIGHTLSETTADESENSTHFQQVRWESGGKCLVRDTGQLPAILPNIGARGQECHVGARRKCSSPG